MYILQDSFSARTDPDWMREQAYLRAPNAEHSPPDLLTASFLVHRSDIVPALGQWTAQAQGTGLSGLLALWKDCNVPVEAEADTLL